MHTVYKNSRALPADRLWCRRCTTWSPPAAFAKTRLDAAVKLLAQGHRLGSDRVLDVLICNNCAGAQVKEMRCTGDGKMRSLDDFSTSQKRDPDNARCRKCQREIENVAPGKLGEEKPDDSDEEYCSADAIETESVAGGVSLSASHGFLPLPASTARSSRLTTTAVSTASKPKPPPVDVGSSGFAKVKAGHREQEVPQLADDDVELADDEEYEM